MKRLISATIGAVVLSLAAHAQTPCGSLGVLVDVSPAQPKVGDVITVTLTNLSNVTIQLPDSCVFDSVHNDNACSTTPVFSPFCLQVITPIPPGGSKSTTWDQTDDFGAQVPSGTYSFAIKFFTPTGTDGCCAVTKIEDPCPPPTHYGSGSVGSGGCTPTLAAAGLPQIGNASFQLQLGNALGGTLTGLFVSGLPANIPAPFGTLLVDPNPPFVQVFFSIGGTPGVPCVGSAVLPAPIPNLAILVGVSGYGQALFQDPGSSGGISTTDGIKITICA
jgi:hypothetical protein